MKNIAISFALIVTSVFIVIAMLVGCAAPRAVTPDTAVYLSATPDALAVSCGGFINGVRMPNYPLAPVDPKCKFLANPYVMAGDNLWKACNTDKAGVEACVATPLSFTLTVTPSR